MITQSNEITFAGKTATLEQGDTKKFGPVDVSIHGGELIVKLGDMDVPGGGFYSGNLTCNGEIYPVSIESGQTIPLVMEPVFGVPAKLAPHVEFYIGNGPPLDQAPLQDLNYSSLGPNPDPEDADGTGSGRVFGQGSPMLRSLLIKHTLNPEVDPSTVEHEQEVERWVRAQGRRGCNFYHSNSEHKAFSAREERKHGTGLGYRKPGGGFNTLYGHTIPPGFEPFDGVGGDTVGDASHLTIESLMTSAAYYGSRAAAEIAWATWQSVMSFMYANARWSSRSYGWVSGAAADLLVISQVHPSVVDMESVMIDLDFMFDRLKSKNYLGMPCPDNGRTSEGGHLDFNTLKMTLGNPPFNFTDAEVQEAARSDVLFMVGILITNLEKLLQVFDGFNAWGVLPMKDHPLRKKVMEQSVYATKFISDQCWTYSYDISKPLSQAWSRSASGLWQDVASKYRLAEGGGSHNDMVGVIIRFVVPAIYLASKRHYIPDLLKTAEKTLQHCANENYYGSSDSLKAFMEYVWPVGMERGWFLR